MFSILAEARAHNLKKNGVNMLTLTKKKTKVIA